VTKRHYCHLRSLLSWSGGIYQALLESTGTERAIQQSSNPEGPRDPLQQIQIPIRHHSTKYKTRQSILKSTISSLSQRSVESISFESKLVVTPHPKRHSSHVQALHLSACRQHSGEPSQALKSLPPATLSQAPGREGFNFVVIALDANHSWQLGLNPLDSATPVFVQQHVDSSIVVIRILERTTRKLWQDGLRYEC
jgi:hypothetical protein